MPYERPAVLHLADVLVTGSGSTLSDAGVAVEGDTVVAVDTAERLDALHPHARTRRWRGVMTPGLVNAHTHLQFTDFADLASAGLTFVEWIREMTARSHRTTPEEWAAGARRGVHALLRTGTTCVADVVTHPPAFAPVTRSGLAGVSYLEIVGVDAQRWPAARARLEADLSAAPQGRDIGLAPHALYTLGDPVLLDVVRLARDSGRRLHLHLAESTDETAYVRCADGRLADVARQQGFAFELLDAPSGRSPVEHAAALGALGRDVHIAHGVHADAGDRARLREAGTAVALCWRSNRLLGAGEPPVAAYLAEGSTLAVGTDSAASSPDLDLIAELSALRDLALAQGAPADGLDQRLVQLATAQGAAALGLAGRAGVLRPGVRADLAVFDVPTDGDPYAALVTHGAGRCVATVLAGRLAHRAA